MATKIAALLLLAALVDAPAASGSELSPVLDVVHWSDGSDQIAQHFGARAIRLAPPIEFGDSYVDVALRDQALGGYRFAVYFQMDKASHRLKRIMFERQRHGANPAVFRAVTAALERDYGAASEACGAPARRRNGYQGAGEQVWNAGDLTIRAVFRDTSIEAGEGCVEPGYSACGLTGHLYVQIFPRMPGAAPCR